MTKNYYMLGLWLVAACLAPASLNAQVARWVIAPAYDEMAVAQGSNIIVADSAGHTSLWTTAGRCTARLADGDQLHPYNEKRAIVTPEDNAIIVAVYDEQGFCLADFSEAREKWKAGAPPVGLIQAARAHTAFHDGHLLIFDGQYYGFMDSDGHVDQQRFATAYPFSHGVAACFSYENLHKTKSPFYQLIDTDLKPVTLMADGRPVARKDINFISSANDEGKAVVIVKRKAYIFDVPSMQMQPLYPTSGDNNAKHQARLEGDLAANYTAMGDSAVLNLRCDRDGSMAITFNENLQPVAIASAEGTQRFAASVDTPVAPQSSLRKVYDEQTHKIALYWGDRLVLPPQFSRVPVTTGDKAVVSQGKKYGMIAVNPNATIRLRLNRDEPIAFRHSRFLTTLRADLPPYIDASTATIETESPECIIDKVSKDTRSSSDGGYVQYDVELAIPRNITDQPRTISYPAHITYQGLRSTTFNVEAKAWHSRYHNVDIVENSISGTTLTFTFDVTAQLLQGEAVYPHQAAIKSDSLQTQIIERVSESRYKCRADGLREGENTIVVQITEDGCPPALYTFNIEYTPPREHHQKAKVQIKKKEYLDV